MSIKILWKYFMVPSPKELGMTDHDSCAMPMRAFQRPGNSDFTWEDYEEKIKKNYPVRYFIVEQFVPWIKFKFRIFVQDPIYWLKCHLITKHKYHLIDIRGPKNDPESYRYGWIDADKKLVLSAFTILNDFVEDEMQHSYCPSEEEVEENISLLNQRNSYLEIKAIYYWWNIERKRQEVIHDELLAKWSHARQTNDPMEHQIWVDLQKHEDVIAEKTDEIIIRLFKVRHSMWT